MKPESNDTITDADAIGDMSARDIPGRPLLWQIMLFLIFSGTAAVANLVSGYLFYEILGYKEGFLYGISVAMAFVVGMVVSFSLNRRYTFETSGRQIHQEMRTFLMVSIGGLLLTVGLSSLFRDLLLPWLLAGLDSDGVAQVEFNREAISHVAAVGLVAGYSFMAHKYLSFGKGIRNCLKLVAGRMSGRDE